MIFMAHRLFPFSSQFLGGGRYVGTLDEHLQAAALDRMPEKFKSLVQKMSPHAEEEASTGDFDMGSSCFIIFYFRCGFVNPPAPPTIPNLNSPYATLWSRS
jgi:hypothetical protein